MEGDSTMDQALNSLLSMIYVDKGGCADHIYFHREFGSRNRIDALSSKLLESSADIAIFNAGAWFHADDDMMRWWQSFTSVVQLPGVSEIRRKRNMSFIWRTNHPGHVNCFGTVSPSNTTLETYYQYLNESIDVYNWSGFSRWDKQSTINAEQLGMKVLDMSMLYSRPDAHPTNGDCLHYCLPGPTDMFSLGLLHMLFNKEI